MSEFPRYTVVKNPPANAGNTRDVGSIPGSGISPGGGGCGTPLQYSCLENPMDRGAWQSAVHGVAQSRTPLTRLSTHACVSIRDQRVLLHAPLVEHTGTNVP